jgi:hypothetical protein
MPFIQFYGPSGDAFSITSSDPEVIRGWLLEQCRRMAPGMGGHQARLMIQPYRDVHGELDWDPAERPSYLLLRQQLEALAAWLEDSQHPAPESAGPADSGHDYEAPMAGGEYLP